MGDWGLAKNFDARAERFRQQMLSAAHWRDHPGSAYSTRLLTALRIAEQGVAELRQLLVEDGVAVPPLQDDGAIGQSATPS